MNHYPQSTAKFSCTINPSVFEQWYAPQPGCRVATKGVSIPFSVWVTLEGKEQEQLERKEWHSGFNAVTWIYRYKRETRPGDVEICHYCNNLQPCNIQETSTDPLYFCSDTITCAFLAWYQLHNYPVVWCSKPINLRATVLGDKGICQIMNYDVLHRVNYAVLPKCALSWLARALEIENWKGDL